ncbi:MAG: bifunctional 3-deoxy-7-phosphoheptulonate synthase/chorismate mutase type II [Bacteroidales bacterium]|nr:bifunctional 3-deoxy-7-phosphoheptulonate synthase/chorismate mutase type II [Bacteroidales bacterium]
MLDLVNIEDWLAIDTKPLVIAGPCSAETEEQVMDTASQLAAIPNVKIFRAGIWKPRSRPGEFEGIGKEGLLWLQEVQKEYGLKTAIEVAEPKHVELALKHGVDILWVGARTVVNPFSMQTIVDALKGIDIPVMVKNPINPDINLWRGALERLNTADIKKLVAIHRGFSDYRESIYRNNPYWEIPIELKRNYPELPVICDPSHITGNPDYLGEISQIALNLEMKGLMIETHRNPQAALSDAFQQVTPAKLSKIIGNLQTKYPTGSPDFQQKLAGLRARIDHADHELIGNLAERFELVNEIAHHKKEHQITILQLERWKKLLENRIKKGTDKGLDKAFIQKLFDLIHTESIKRQTEIVDRKNEG